MRKLIGRYLRAYLAQVNHYAGTEDDDDFALTSTTPTGPVQWRWRRPAPSAGRPARRDDACSTRACGASPRTRTVRRLGRAERRKVVTAFGGYLETIPESKRFDRDLFYELRDVVGKSGFGIGSAGLPAYNVLVEGYSQALDNDVVLSMKQANVPAVSRFVDTSEVDAYFDHEGHRTVVSQRALQVHTDPLLGHTSIDGVGYVVAEVSPYEFDLDWGDINEPADMRERRRTARPGHRQDPLRLRRGQRPGPGRLPGRGGHRASRSRVAARSSPRGVPTAGSTTPPGCARTTRCSSTRSAKAGWGSRRPERVRRPSRLAAGAAHATPAAGT